MGNRKVKILVTHPEHWARGYAGEHGAEVMHVDPGGDNPKRMDGSPTLDGIGQVCTPTGVEKLVEVADKFKPDVFLFAIHHNLLPMIVDGVRKASGCKVVMHYTDQRDGVPPEVSKYKGLLDLLLVTNQDAADHAKYVDGGFVPAVRTMYDGVDVEVYNANRVQKLPPVHDVFFGGHNYHGLIKQFRQAGREPPREIVFPGGEFRDRFLSAVNARFDMVVFGQHGWNGMFDVRKPVYHPNYVWAMAEGRIVLSTTNAVRRGLVTRRTLRSLACGRMFITDYLHGYEEMFGGNGEHFVWYRSLEDGVEKIKRYLLDNDERRRVERNAAKLIAAKHTFPHRLTDFVDVVGEVF